MLRTILTSARASHNVNYCNQAISLTTRLLVKLRCYPGSIFRNQPALEMRLRAELTGTSSHFSEAWFFPYGRNDALSASTGMVNCEQWQDSGAKSSIVVNRRFHSLCTA